MRAGGVFPDRLVRLANFTDIPVEAAVPAAAGPFLYVGRLAYPKAVDTIVRAVGLAPEATLDIIGDGPERAALESVAESEAPGRVRFLGHVDRAAVATAMAGARGMVGSAWITWSSTERLTPGG